MFHDPNPDNRRHKKGVPDIQGLSHGFFRFLLFNWSFAIVNGVFTSFFAVLLYMLHSGDEMASPTCLLTSVR